jgi:hypothetical protein
MFSRSAFLQHSVGWTRVGDHVSYYRNKVPFLPSMGKKGFFNTLTFTVTFEFGDDECFLAYHYPYSYSCLTEALDRWHAQVAANNILVRQPLCSTLAGNVCELLTVTSFLEEDLQTYPLEARQYVVVTSRVHPGESNASWMMHGHEASRLFLS